MSVPKLEIIFEKLNNFSQSLIPYYDQDLEINDLEKTAELGTVALSRSYLLDPETPAPILYQAAKNILTDKFVGYEPETVWLEFERLGLDVPEENRNKLSVVSALQSQDPLIYDSNVFQGMILAFNNEIANPEVTEEVDPEQIAWAIVNLTLLFPDTKYYFDYEPMVYTAVVLHRAGILKAPATLGYCQEYLDNLNKNNDLVEKITEAEHNKPLKSDPLYDIVSTQLAKLERIDTYVEQMYTKYTEQLQKLLEPKKLGEKIAKILEEKKKLTERKTTFGGRRVEMGLGSISETKSSDIDVTQNQPGAYDTKAPTFTLSVVGA